MTTAVKTTAKNQTVSSDKKTDKWFDNMIGHLLADQVTMQAGVMQEERKGMYDMFVRNNEMEIAQHTRNMGGFMIFKELLHDYVSALSKRDPVVQELAMSFSNAKLLIWARVNDDDEKSEDALIMAEAAVNAKYFQYDFYVSSMIVEQSDDYIMPKHYHIFDLEQLKDGISE